MAEASDSPGRRIRRCHRACARCRDMKVRCSGVFPCSRCQRLKEMCDFQEAESRASIPKSYLRSLQEKANASVAKNHTSRGDALAASERRLAPAVGVKPSPAQSLEPPDRASCPRDEQQGRQASELHDPVALPSPRTTGTSSAENDASPGGFNRNPLVGGDETFAVGSDGKAWFLGLTSSWSFCRRVLALIASRLPEPTTPPDPWTLDHFEFSWSPLGPDAQPVVDDLPAQDCVTFLAHSVKYHLGTLSPIIDDDIFFAHVSKLYQNPAAEAGRSRLWYAQFLLVLAFGEAIRNKKGTYPVPGTQFAARAMSLIPNFLRINKNSMLAVETLCLSALYLQALDLRLEAFQVIGQALRICTLKGIHRHASAAEVGEHHSKRYNSLFWATYILDRHFSALIGAPSSIRDEDITAKLPAELADSTLSVAMTLHIRLSRLTAEILAGVYGVDTQSSDSLLSKTQSMLHKIAGICTELNAFLKSADTDVNAQDNKRKSPLHCVQYGRRKSDLFFVDRLLKKGACIFATDSMKQTALHLASSKGDALSVALLLKCDTHLTFADGMLRDVKVSRESISTCRTEAHNLLNVKDQEGRTPLHLAVCSCGNLETTRMLLDAGANANATDLSGNTPLELFFKESFFHDISICQLLLEQTDLTLARQDGLTLAHLCANGFRLEVKILELLQSHGVDFTATDSQGRTFLHHAAIEGMITEEVLQFLFRSTTLHTDTRDLNGNTALQYAFKEAIKERHPLCFDSKRWERTCDVLLQYETT